MKTNYKMFILILFFAISSSSFAQKTSPPASRSITEIARENIDETTQRLCVHEFSQEKGAKALRPFATISEMCGCMKSEMRYTVNDELANNLIKAQLDNEKEKGERKYISKDEADIAFAEYLKHLSNARSSCIEQFIRRKGR